MASGVAPPTPRAFFLALFMSLFAGPLVGIGFGVLMRTQGSDAWFGLQTSIVCGEVCDGCHGPLERRGGTRVVQGAGRGRPSVLYCQPPTGSLDEVSNIDRFQVGSGGETLFLLGSIVPAIALVWAALFVTLRARFKRQAATRAPST